jgi:hypothetical protein
MKTKGQPNEWVTKPPKEGPIANPAEMLMALMPKALPLSCAGKEAVMMAKGTAIIIPAASPWIARKAISQ